MPNILIACFILIIVHVGLCPAAEGAGDHFPQISGMYKAGIPEIFGPENLYEYINGAAESYLMYEFRDLAVQVYENDQDQSVTVEIYHHQSPLYSFGIYSQERSRESNFLNIGSQGYYEKGILNFLKGDYYVKISTFDFKHKDQSILRQFAEQTARLLEGEEKLPRPLHWLPSEGKIVNSERFISRNFLGYSFFRNVFTADYKVADSTFTLFLLQTDKPEECEEILKSYLQATNGMKENIREGYITINDPYQGSIGILWKNRYLLGTVNLESEELKMKYLKLGEERIQY